MSSSSRPRDGDGPRTANASPTDRSASRAPRPNRRAPDRNPPEELSKPRLRLEVVEDGDGPDRGTVYPPGLTGIERMETWLSVNASVVVDLAAWR